MEDLSKLQTFLEQAFGSRPDAPFVQPAMMSWKYWDDRDDWSGPRSYLLERDGAIVAHAGLWPLTFGTGAGALRGIHMIDWASAREVPGAGLALVQKLAALFDFIVAIGGSEMTRKVLPAFGFAEQAQQWTGTRPLRPVRQIITHQTRNWKLAPRLVRNSLLAWRGTKSVEGWRSAEIRPRDIAPELYAEQNAENAHASPRSPAFFEYLSRCPAARVTLYGIYDDRGLRGHFALTLVRGQARVAGVWLIKPDRVAWNAAYALAQQSTRQLHDASEIVATGTGDLSGKGAADSGFRVSKSAPVYLLNKRGKLTLSTGFQFQLSDDDEAVLDTGAVAYRT